MPHSPTHSSCHPSVSGAGGASLCSRPVILTCGQFMCCAELDPYSFVLSSVMGELQKGNTGSHDTLLVRTIIIIISRIVLGRSGSFNKNDTDDHIQVLLHLHD